VITFGWIDVYERDSMPGNLVLTRKAEQTVVCTFGDVQLNVTVVEVRGEKVRIAFSAPDCVEIMRAELLERNERKSDAAE